MPLSISEVGYSRWPNCRLIDNGTVQVVVAVDFGPRIVCYRFAGGDNILGELGPDAVIETKLGDYHLQGGHRLWHAPEDPRRSYVPDDDPVRVGLIGDGSILLTQAVEEETGIEKEMLVSLEGEGTRVTVEHRLTNRGPWPIELAAWAPTIMRGGGTTIVPNEPYVPEQEKVLPARPIVVWHYTDLADPRLTFGARYIRLSTDGSRKNQIKIGVMNKQKWACYQCGSTLFVKMFPFIEDAHYADYGCNFETYTAGDFMELESLGPLVALQPGESTLHVEQWHLFGGIPVCGNESSIDAEIMPLVQSAGRTV